MGAGASQRHQDEIRRKSGSTAKLLDEVGANAISGGSGSGKWKIMPSSDEARQKFHKDGTLNKNSDPEQLELRAVLDEPIAQQMLGNYAKEYKSLEIFMCWIDVQEYKSIPTDDYRRSKALHIYHKYIKADSILQIGGIHGEDVQYYKNQIDLGKNDHSILKREFYDRVQNVCFIEIFHNIFRPFKSTVQYVELKRALKEKYNHVALDHFEYVRKLGEGGFGCVVHCVKISTGKHYAMKIQTKKGLLECFADDPWRVDGEKQAFASCQHPFIVNLDYAFQSETLAIMVLGLASAGDLQKALLEAPEEKLSEERVQFYAAELVLALAHLHQMGLMYRDLKPNNVLVNDDGHVQLVDLGGVVDEDGKVIGAQHETNALLPLFTHQYSALASAARAQYLANTKNDARDSEEKADLRSTDDSPKKRRMSIMGTFGCVLTNWLTFFSIYLFTYLFSYSLTCSFLYYSATLKVTFRSEVIFTHTNFLLTIFDFGNYNDDNNRYCTDIWPRRW